MKKYAKLRGDNNKRIKMSEYNKEECECCGLENSADEVDQKEYSYKYLCSICEKNNQPNPNSDWY